MKADAKSVSDLPNDYKPHALGDAAQLRVELSSFFGNAIDWSDPAWGTLNGQAFSYEFNFSESGIVDSFTLHVRGGGDAVSPIVAMCKHFDWKAVDASEGEFIDLEDPSTDGWDGFQEFRDRAIGQADDADGKSSS
ncbi:hypothetical protein [Rubripirellula obstinata]|nr:hypothetical protein [Rubripirellula obstinata]